MNCVNIKIMLYKIIEILCYENNYFFMNDLVFVQFVSTYKWINLKAHVSLLCNKLWDSQMISVYTIYLFKIELFGLAMKKKTNPEIHITFSHMKVDIKYTLCM